MGKKLRHHSSRTLVALVPAHHYLSEGVELASVVNGIRLS